MPDEKLIHFQHRQRTTGIPDLPLDKLRWHIAESSKALGVPPRSLHVAHDVWDGAYQQVLRLPNRRREALGVVLEFPGGIPVRNNRRIWKLGGTWIEPRDLPDGLVLPVLGVDRSVGVNGERAAVESIVGPETPVERPPA